MPPLFTCVQYNCLCNYSESGQAWSSLSTDCSITHEKRLIEMVPMAIAMGMYGDSGRRDLD